MTVLGVALLLAAALAGAPLVAVLMGAAMLGFLASGIDLAAVPIEVYRIVDTPLLVALPLFTYAGYVLAEANTSQRAAGFGRELLRLAAERLGHRQLNRLRPVHRLDGRLRRHHRGAWGVAAAGAAAGRLRRTVQLGPGHPAPAAWGCCWPRRCR